MTPDGTEGDWKIVTAVPPLTAIRLRAEPAQNASDCPSGENTGLIAVSVPGIALDSKSDMDRRYSRPSAPYTMRVPSGDMATAPRLALNCCPSGRVNASRVTGPAGSGLKCQTTVVVMAAEISTAPAMSIARRPTGHGRGRLASTDCSGGWPSRKSAVDMSPMRSFQPG